MSKIIVKVPAAKTFDLPCGQFRATLDQIKPITKQTKKGPQQWVRLVFQVQVPEMTDQIPCAGRNFPLDLNPGSDLRNFLESWLGSDFFASLSNKDLDFDTLIGKQADICLSHFQGEEYSKPHVNIENAYPPSTLTLEGQKATSLAPKAA